MKLNSQLRQFFRVYPSWGFAPPRVQCRRSLEQFGSDYGGYLLDASLLHSGSIVYSIGVGEDISFDLALIDRFGVSVEAFDPTPRVASWLATQALPSRFHFHAVGVATRDGEESFHLPPRVDWISHSVVSDRQFSRQVLRLPVMRLATAMRLQNHRRIDVLKMDIEGAEYAVIEEIVRDKIQVGQFLIEFHHRLSSVGTRKTRRALALLESYGMKISAICPRKEVFTLVQAA